MATVPKSDQRRHGVCSIVKDPHDGRTWFKSGGHVFVPDRPFSNPLRDWSWKPWAEPVKRPESVAGVSGHPACAVCGYGFVKRRPHTRTCSTKCRSRLSRARK